MVSTMTYDGGVGYKASEDDRAGLTSVKILGGVTHIGRGAFHGCRGLKSVTLPGSVTHIGQGAFRGCAGLTSVIIPEGVTKIGAAAFADCTGLTSVTMSKIPTINSRAFDRNIYANVPLDALVEKV